MHAKLAHISVSNVAQNNKIYSGWNGLTVPSPMDFMNAQINAFKTSPGD